MVVHPGQVVCWTVTFFVLIMAAATLTVSIVALLMFAMVVYHLVFQLGLANWSGFGVGALLFAIIGVVWLIGNWLLDLIAGLGSRSRPRRKNHRARIILPWLGTAGLIGVLFYLFAK